MSLSDKLIEYLYRESQRNFRKAKLELATAEQSFEDMKKIVKRKKINFFFGPFVDLHTKKVNRHS